MPSVESVVGAGCFLAVVDEVAVAVADTSVVVGADEDVDTVVQAFAAYSAFVDDDSAVVVVVVVAFDAEAAADSVANEGCFSGIYFHLHEKPLNPQRLPVV